MTIVPRMSVKTLIQLFLITLCCLLMCGIIKMATLITSGMHRNPFGKFARTPDITFQQRKDRLERVCATNKVPGRIHGVFTHKSGVLYCFVPKAGCTFWKGVFYTAIFANESNHVTLSKNFIHTAYVTGTPYMSRHNAAAYPTRFIVARDPYSRLLSSYLDKIYLPDFWPTNALMMIEGRNSSTFSSVRELRKTDFLRRHYDDVMRLFPTEAAGNSTLNDTACGKYLTFRDFIVDGFFLQEPHWVPIHMICNPCVLNVSHVSYMETFTSDAEVLLYKMGLGHLLDDISPDVQVDIRPDGQVDISPDGQVDIRPDGQVDISPDGQVDIRPDGHVDISPDGQVDISLDVQVDISLDGQVDISPDGQVDISPDGQVDISSDGQVDISLDGQVDISPDGQVDISPDGQVDISPDGQVDISLDGQVDISPDGQVDISPDGQVDISSDGQVDISSDGQVDIRPDGQVDIRSDGQVDVSPDGQVDIRPDGQVDISPDGQVEISPDGQVDISSDGQVDISLDGQVDISPDGQVDISPDGQVDISPDGQVDISLDGQVDISPDGQVDISPDGQVDVSPDGQVDISPDGQVDISLDGQVDISPDGQVDISPDGQVDISSDGQVDISSDSQVDIRSDGQVDVSPDGQVDIRPDGQINQEIRTTIDYNFDIIQKTTFKNFFPNCITSSELGYRIWQSFIWRGYIDPNIEYTIPDFTDDTRVKADLQEQVWRARKSGMAKPESMRRAKDAFKMAAYSTLSSSLFSLLTRKYRFDFKLFGYESVRDKMLKSLYGEKQKGIWLTNGTRLDDIFRT
ncbi:hypothetical protein Btru_057106 [Bulinus truncatus]|nr:hypothetical protein Btru_057106 [Bulinus truncatus]